MSFQHWRDCRLDDVAREFVERNIDRILQQEVSQLFEWIGRETTISSLRDMGIGFVVGVMQSLAEVSCLVGRKKDFTESEENEEDEEIRVMIRRRLPEIVEQIDLELENKQTRAA